MSGEVEVRMLGAEEAAVLERVAEDVFDEDVQPDLAREFLADPRHHIAVALEGGEVVGMASALSYVHPDKRAEYFVNEVGVAPTHQRRGIGRRLMQVLLAHGRSLGCKSAWVGTEDDNEAARGLYADAKGKAESFVMYTFDLSAAPSGARSDAPSDPPSDAPSDEPGS
ncbi:MAG: GNAT family N-acetyltransferase [Myxococcota bacterium]|nr:GNAT family N-acetyltransferase [Myxococcota bacterium]